MNFEKRGEEEGVTRRDFLGLMALGAFSAAMIMSLIGLLKFMKPALLPDVSHTFKIGRLKDIPVDSTKIYAEQKVLVKRDSEGVAAISLICTHLGCVVKRTEEGFACPCHGSFFDNQGRVLKGPAPKPLPWFEVSLDPSGKLVVNTGKEVPLGTKLTV
ncbi:MAG: ubiquinol-cytochrome c reductase iron-sulfur subunit [Spirochaetota bacterium]